MWYYLIILIDKTIRYRDIAKFAIYREISKYARNAAKNLKIMAKFCTKHNF